MQTIAEIAHSITTMPELQVIVEEHGGQELLNLYLAIEAEGITDPQLAIQLLLHREAVSKLGKRCDLLGPTAEGKVAILLPLPPFLCDTFLPIADPNLIFTTFGQAEPIPPHVRGLIRSTGYRSLSSLPASQQMRMASEVEGVILDGQLNDGELNVREMTEDFIHHLSNGPSSRLKTLYVHSINVPPHQVQFRRCPVQANITIVEI